MARRKDKDSSAGALVVLLVIAIALATPLALAGWWIICEIRVAPFKRTALHDVLPSEEEKAELLTIQQEADHWSAEVSRIEDRALDAGARRRMDGGFDGRSRAGQEANERLETAELARQEAALRYATLLQVLTDRVDTCVTYVSQTQGARLGVMAFSALFFLSYAWSGNWIVASLACGLVSGLLIWGRTVLAELALRRQLSAD